MYGEKGGKRSAANGINRCIPPEAGGTANPITGSGIV
jgi:hypothetical protein